MRRYIWMFVFLFVSLLAGCEKQEVQGELGAGQYEIYYLNSGLTRLVPLMYQTETTDPDELAQELLNQFMTIPADVDLQVAKPDRVVYLSGEREDNVFYLYFDNNYTSMRPEREILCRAALVKTLTQVSGIDYINISSGEQPIMDSNRMPIGMLAASDFVDSISDVNAYEKSDLQLYFTDVTGELLWEEEREVVHDVNTSVERLIIEELIKGPQAEGLYPTLPRDLKLLNVSVNENVCYINFDAAFLTSALEVREYIPIYSIVNSLSELSTVNRVQISVGGSPEVTFREVISLNALFERNLDYVGGE